MQRRRRAWRWREGRKTERLTASLASVDTTIAVAEPREVIHS
jgi:hypothetical protein